MLQRVLVAIAQRQFGGDNFPARFLGEKSGFDALGWLKTLDTTLDVRRGWIEGLPGGHALAALIVLHHLDGGRRGRDSDALGVLGRYVKSDRSIARLQVMMGHAHHIGARDSFQAVT